MNTRTAIDIDIDQTSAGFEWEELPSLTNVVLRRHVPKGSYTLAASLVAEARARLGLRSEPHAAPVWEETRPATFEPLHPSAPLRETELGGLDAREIIEPDVFKHFFGTTSR